MFFWNSSRRHFLQTTAAALASLIFPRSLFAKNPDRSFWFIHTDTLNSWPVGDPVAWSLENARQPVLERATEGLLKLTADDGDRIIRLVVRRCRLKLLELRPGQVVVYHWASHRADLRPDYKQHRLARQEVHVVLRERKKEISMRQSGDDFLLGDRLTADILLDVFVSKFASRFEPQPDDWQAAPGTWSGFAWEGIEDGRIPWVALKSAWRRAAPMICSNCDTPTILTNFGLPWTGMFNRTPRFVHFCGTCRRSFKDEVVMDVNEWIERNLDAEARPDAEMVWDRRVTREMA